MDDAELRRLLELKAITDIQVDSADDVLEAMKQIEAHGGMAALPMMVEDDVRLPEFEDFMDRVKRETKLRVAHYTGNEDVPPVLNMYGYRKFFDAMLVPFWRSDEDKDEFINLVLPVIFRRYSIHYASITSEAWQMDVLAGLAKHGIDIREVAERDQDEAQRIVNTYVAGLPPDKHPDGSHVVIAAFYDGLKGNVEVWTADMQRSEGDAVDLGEWVLRSEGGEPGLEGVLVRPVIEGLKSAVAERKRDN